MLSLKNFNHKLDSEPAFKKRIISKIATDFCHSIDDEEGNCYSSCYFEKIRSVTFMKTPKNHVENLKELIAKDETRINKIFCDNCGENLIFTFKKDETLFHIPLSKILECLLIAEAEGEVPEIEESWWNELEELYPNIEHLRIELKSD